MWGDTEFPVDVTYLGTDDDGMHEWAAPMPDPPPELGPQSVIQLRVAMLPARTTIVLVPPEGDR
ncbi:hypothetical protein [Nocardia wallacei]|uniref:hypothetical protein n=1 Tax=Nocardia wallacei TaxID=480035 RepID=UPI002453E08D|nr:hypothetical protein [Nocardia wallacei]